MVERKEPESCLNGLLGPDTDKDYGPNDLALEGRGPQPCLARQTSVAFLACGRHATGCFGAPVVGAHVAALLGIDLAFRVAPNPARATP